MKNETSEIFERAAKKDGLNVRDWLVKKNKTMSMTELARQFCIAPQRARHQYLIHKIKIQKRSGTTGFKKVTESNQDIQKMFNSGMTVDQIAYKINCSSSTVRAALSGARRSRTKKDPKINPETNKPWKFCKTCGCKIKGWNYRVCDTCLARLPRYDPALETHSVNYRGI